jgi:hypothetical protein
MIVNAEGERDSMSEGEYYALHQVALNTLDVEAHEEETLYCDGDDQQKERKSGAKHFPFVGTPSFASEL